MEHTSRRDFFKAAAITSSAAFVSGCSTSSAQAMPAQTFKLNKNPLKLGLMSYTLAKDWDIDTIIKNCKETKFQHVELRTTHAHGVEVNLSKAQRKEVRKKFEDSGIRISLASGFAYHWDDPAKLKQQIEGTKEYTLLGEDIGAIGIRVFPNALMTDKGIPVEKTLEQIGKSLAQVGQFGHDHGVDIRVCVHGNGTDRIPLIKKMIDYSQSPYVYVNWNCSPHDTDSPGFEANFHSIKDRIRNIHMHELWDEKYPYRKLFMLLKAENYQGYCDAEIPANNDPIRIMKYYRSLFLALQNAY